ncbi:MAG: nuclear transport factor 2 family protein [Pirellulales bacterium]|nr:nuclear transport factor 2 family protein [Pirellulales bacterium]
MSDLPELTRRYFAALEAGATGEALAPFYAPDVVQEEFPNRLNPRGARRDLAALLASAERGQQVMASQRYEIVNLVAAGERVAVEFRWSGKLAISIGPLQAGDELRGYFATFLAFRDGRIIAQTNYDCLES